MSSPGWLTPEDCSIGDLAAAVSSGTAIDDYPWAAQVVDDVLLYSAAALQPTMADPTGRRVLQAELERALSDGPGIIVLTGAYPDTDVVDAASAVFDDIVEERRALESDGERMAVDTVADALRRLEERSPRAFADYCVNDAIALVAQARLGPSYELTSTVRVVNPGAPADDIRPSSPLATMDPAGAAQFPAPVHLSLPRLAVHAIVAHTDIDVDSGSMRFLPHSQKYVAGAIAWRRSEFRSFALERSVAFPLFKGDIAFFDPAVFSGAGANTTTVIRTMANAVRASSAFASPDAVSGTGLERA